MIPVTFANGGDNIGVYSSLFATSNAKELIILLCIFYVLLAIWCIAGYVLTRRSRIAEALSAKSKFVVPLVLIGLGLYILAMLWTQ